MANLYFYYGTTNAGKSTYILQSAYNYEEQGNKIALYTSVIDDRYEVGQITSRIGIASKCNVFSQKTSFMNEISPVREGLSCLFVDEAQFLLCSQVKELRELTTQLDLPVVCFGLRSDFMGEPFEGAVYLMNWADKIKEIKSICKCGQKATMTIRINESKERIYSGERIEIGGNDKYQAVCAKHFF